MTIKRLYTQAPMFPNAHVMRVDFPYKPMGGTHEADYLALIRNLRKEITGTWGYTTLTESRIQKYDKNDYEKGIVYRAFMIFKDDVDILHIRLKYDKDFKSASMWPTNLRFTIHEFVDENT